MLIQKVLNIYDLLHQMKLLHQLIITYIYNYLFLLLNVKHLKDFIQSSYLKLLTIKYFLIFTLLNIFFFTYVFANYPTVND